MGLTLLIFGLLSDTFLAALVGLVGASGYIVAAPNKSSGTNGVQKHEIKNANRLIFFRLAFCPVVPAVLNNLINVDKR